MAIFGDNTDGGVSFPGSAERILLSPFTCPTSGTITSMSAIMDEASNGASNVKFLIYADNAGSRGNLLATSAPVNSPIGGGTITQAVNQAVVGGATYWLGLVWEGYSNRVATDNSGLMERYEGPGGTYANPPATFVASQLYAAATSNAQSVNVWATYTESGGGGGAIGFVPLGLDIW